MQRKAGGLRKRWLYSPRVRAASHKRVAEKVRQVEYITKALREIPFRDVVRLYPECSPAMIRSVYEGLLRST